MTFFEFCLKGLIPTPEGVSFINFKPEEFSYLNITSLGLEHVQNDIECGFACLRITSCFSYSLAAFSDLSGKLLCELLPSDKFNNSDKFTISPLYHHFSIPVSTNWIMLLRFFQEDQKVSQNSPRSAIVSYAWRFVHDVLLLRTGWQSTRIAMFRLWWGCVEEGSH